MPYCQIPRERLEYLSVFGFHVVEETDDYYAVFDPNQRVQVIDKLRPLIWFDDEDVGEAIMMGSVGIVVGP